MEKIRVYGDSRRSSQLCLREFYTEYYIYRYHNLEAVRRGVLHMTSRNSINREEPPTDMGTIVYAPKFRGSSYLVVREFFLGPRVPVQDLRKSTRVCALDTLETSNQQHSSTLVCIYGTKLHDSSLLSAIRV